MESLHLLQARYWDLPLSLESARLLVHRKCTNMVHFLNYYHVYRKKVCADNAQFISIASHKIWNTTLNLQSAHNRTNLLLIEGRATRIYWNAYSLIAKQERWKRIYPHATDSLNSALNIGYTMLANILRKHIIKHGLSCEIGVLHVPQRGNEALLYDFEELFRQPLVDMAILPLFSRKKSIEAINEKLVIKSLLQHFEKSIHYKKSKWQVEAVIDVELETYSKALVKRSIYIPYQHSWSHWVGK